MGTFLLPARKDTSNVLYSGVVAPKGFKVSAAKAGLRRSGTRSDCALLVADADAVSFV